MQREKFLQELKKYGEKNDIPNISEKNATFLKNLIQEQKSKNLLEIWSANGYSTIHFASEIEKTGGKITSIEFSQVAYEEAQENFEAVWVSHLITYYFWDAREIIPLLEDKYDFIFIDGLKKASLEFLKIVWDKALPWSIIIIDDVIKFQHKMKDLYEYVEDNNIVYEVIQIDEDDGIMLIKKEDL